MGRLARCTPNVSARGEVSTNWQFWPIDAELRLCYPPVVRLSKEEVDYIRSACRGSIRIATMGRTVAATTAVTYSGQTYSAWTSFVPRSS